MPLTFLSSLSVAENTAALVEQLFMAGGLAAKFSQSVLFPCVNKELLCCSVSLPWFSYSLPERKLEVLHRPFFWFRKEVAYFEHP